MTTLLKQVSSLIKSKRVRVRVRGGGGSGSEDGEEVDEGGRNIDEEDGAILSNFVEKQTNKSQRSRKDDLIFYAITVIFLAGSSFTAMVVKDLTTILALVGSTGSTTVTYILPGFIYHKTFPDGDLRCLAVLQLCVGLIIMPVALYFTLK